MRAGAEWIPPSTAASALTAAQTLARQTHAVVVVTGEVDHITDGQQDRTVAGGDPLVTHAWWEPRLCALGGRRRLLLAAWQTDNATAACGFMKRAGSVA